MTRDLFVKAAASALRKAQGQSPEQQAEAVAEAMDMLKDLIGETEAPRREQPRGPVPKVAFPPANLRPFEVY